MNVIDTCWDQLCSGDCSLIDTGTAKCPASEEFVKYESAVDCESRIYYQSARINRDCIRSARNVDIFPARAVSKFKLAKALSPGLQASWRDFLLAMDAM
jgi:hypothetical protein